MFSGKAILRLCFVVAFVVCGLPSKSPGAEAPANDLVENARVLPPTVASVTNLTNFGSTVSMGDPETNSVFGNIWFRHAPMSISSTGRVSLAGGQFGVVDGACRAGHRGGTAGRNEMDRESSQCIVRHG